LGDEAKAFFCRSVPELVMPVALQQVYRDRVDRGVKLLAVWSARTGARG